MTGGVKKDAVAALWEEARDLSAPHVDRLRSPPSALRFLREYVAPNKPCVISGGALHWPAISRWPSSEYLSQAMVGRTVSVHLTPDGRADALVPYPTVQSPSPSLCFASALVEQMPFDEALRMVVSSGDPSSPFVAYAQEQNDCLRSEYEPLAADVEPEIPWATEALGCQPEAVNLWIGNGRSETSFHKDHYENLYVVVSGEKDFLLLPPTEIHRMYVRPYPPARYTMFDPETGELKLEVMVEEEEDDKGGGRGKRRVPWCSIDPSSAGTAAAAARESFPLYFEGPKPFHCTVKAGDILYLPSMWFHHVRQTPDNSGRVIAVNYWYDMRFDIKYAYFNFLQSINLTPDKRPNDDYLLSITAGEDDDPS